MNLRFEPDAVPNAPEIEPAEIRAASVDSRASIPSDLPGTPDPEAWRREVAARVNRFRARRQTRAPRYPSLALKFEPSEPFQSTPAENKTPTQDVIAAINAASPIASSDRESVALLSASAPVSEPSNIGLTKLEPAKIEPGKIESTKIIEFPRPWIPPARPADELAEPVLDRPRILEVPEILPPPPAMGGILIEPAEQHGNDKQPGIDIPLQSAPMTQRLLAVAIDSTIVFVALAMFAAIFFKMTHTLPLFRQAAEAGVLLTALFWASYQYLLIVHSGTTPGLRLAKLQLCRFDGEPVARRIRRWRTLASIMSGMSLGLGYAWCFLDEDALCWHDRITKTYMAPKSPTPLAASN